MPRTLDLDDLIPGSPEEVTDRLKAQTCWSPSPYRGGVFTLGNKPLRGRVGGASLTVGLNQRGWWTMLQPTAQATLEAMSGGTRVRGEVGTLCVKRRGLTPPVTM